jgi:transcriptional regulator with XRE-family HTH domain
MKTRRKEILGDLLRRERVIRRISQETLGGVVGLGKTAISAYELGKASPDIEKLDLMCAYMGIDYLDLLREAQRLYKLETDA